MIPRLPVRRTAWWLGLATAWFLGALFTWGYLDRGWIPHDDGYLAHAAERVLSGQVPHRDFTEVYSGGLTYLNALGFRLLGPSFLSLRYILFLVFLAWVPALYYLATRFTRPLAASAVTLLAVLWSVPNYPSSMPSWYNLFFATFGLAALLRYLERRRPVWLLLAGLMGGFSVLVKISGLFFAGASLISLVYLAARESPGSEPVDRSRRFALLAAIPVVLAALGLLFIGLSRWRWVDVYQFTVPGMAVTALAGLAAFHPGEPARVNAGRLLRVLGWYCLGFGIPLSLFAAFYAAQGGLDDLIRGLFLVPSLRYSDTSGLPPSPLAAAATLMVGGALLVGRFLPRRLAALFSGGLAVGFVLALALVLRGHRKVHDLFFWDSIAQATPWVVAGAALLLWRKRHDPDAAARSVRLLSVVAVAAFCSLIQYPTSVPIYFSYVAPLTLLAIAALSRELPMGNRSGLAVAMAVYLVFGAVLLEPFRLVGLTGPLTRQDTARLESPRGGLVTDRETVQLYRQSVELLREHAGSGPMFALDAPELYFLSGLENPLPVIFDFRGDSAFRRSLAGRLTDRGVQVIAIRHATPHSMLLSPPLEPEVIRDLERRFPRSREIEGRIARFTIRWNE